MEEALWLGSGLLMRRGGAQKCGSASTRSPPRRKEVFLQSALGGLKSKNPKPAGSMRLMI